MLFRWLADFVLLLHLAFVAFVVLGGVLVLRRPRLAWVHLPAAVWGVLIEYAGWVCPLTPLEILFRQRGGGAGYSGGFIEHYVTSTLYPEGLTRGVQILLGTVVLLGNLSIYLSLLIRHRRAARARTP
ncbi:MAG: DUF2784 domain-containing protein [Gemmatimonadetes bacterium]|nr:DUF2784 domain-containing protein [Gemmatimonadota bacterium]